jgi:hypothetical protein
MPRASRPSKKLQHKLQSPASHEGHSGVMPRGAHDSQGLSTTRCPGSKPSTSGPSASIVAITSWPNTWGKEMNAVIGLSSPCS